MATLQTTRDSIYTECKELFGSVPDWVQTIPDSVLPGFWNLMTQFHMAETKIPNKYKELIGLAVSGATRCRYCTLFHTEAARLQGATDEEIAEASSMAGLTMFGSTFLNTMQADYDVFKEDTLRIVEYVRKNAASPSATQTHAHA